MSSQPATSNLRGPLAHNVPFCVVAARLGVSWQAVRRVGLERLERCQDDDARRILLRAHTQRGGLALTEDQEMLRAGEYGAARIVRERRRQIYDEHFSLEHDVQYRKDSELLRAALCYAYAAWTLSGGGTIIEVRNHHKIRVLWPWSRAEWKPAEDAERNLEIAGALLAAEIDRLELCRLAAAEE